MADDNNESPPLPRTSLPRAAPRYARTPTSRSGRSHGSSFEAAAESSTVASTRHSLGDITLAPSDRPVDDPDHAARRRRSHKPRPTGGFLLPNPVRDDQPAPRSHGHSPAREGGRRRSRIPVESNRKGKSPVEPVSDRRASLSPAARDPAVDVRDMDDYAAPRESRRRSYNPRPPSNSRIPSPSPEPVAPDMDATQIVNMALNLSESRRMAQRRQVSSPVPPRLAPVPDSPAHGGLKQHLQQQRRTSRTMTPMADPGAQVLRNVSAASARVNTPLQAAFEADGGYTYHFSSSTLNRAQKAREYIELMAQYRRLLDLVPPLQHDGQKDGRSSTSSRPTSPASPTFPQSPSHPHSPVTLGREYNPLQYIRNRKVRARERQVIDGEAQGFADVSKVAHWVDQAATAAALSAFQPDVPPVPIFPGAHLAQTQQPGTSSNIPVPVSSATKPKRPRMDWAIDPADMLADVYWVEQEDNKSLIEDRHYIRLFPKKSPVPSGPPPPRDDDPSTEPRMSLDKKDQGHYSDVSEEHRPSDSNAVSKTDTEASHISARDRARQKLQELRGIHHKHSSSAHSHHDILNFRKSSFSDTSDSEIDRRKRDRSGTVSAKDQAVLEKQMNEMMAQEARDNHRVSLDSIRQAAPEPFRPTLMTPDRVPEPPAASVDSTGDDGDFVETLKRGRMRPGTPVRYGRDSLDVPDYHPRSSLDLDSSVPTSPELKPKKRRSHQLPTVGVDVSPTNSRAGSPVRNPFSKIKNKFRDRSRERVREPFPDHADAIKEETPQSPMESGEQQALSPISAEGRVSLERRRSKSPGWKLPSRSTGDSGHKGHRSMGSLRLGRDDQIGLRSIFRGGVKIDGIIRGGVSKVSDMIWKKDHDDEGGSSSSSSDESDSEDSRGRAGARASLSRTNSLSPRGDRQAKHHLDSMPAFESVLDAEKPTPDEPGTLFVPVNTSSPSRRRSKRFDQLKPPRIDIMSASPPGRSPVLQPAEGVVPETDVSDVESNKRDSALVATQGARNSSSQLNAVLSLPPPSSRPHRGSTATSQRWSITDTSLSAPRTTQLSRREVARLRALVLCSGIRAMEFSRRSEADHALSSLDNSGGAGLSWDDLAGFAAADGGDRVVSQKDVFPATARILASSIESSTSALQRQMQAFAQNDMRRLHGRVDVLHAHVARDLAEMARRATDDADECSRDINDGQRLKVKHVMDVIDKMMRQKRRRFRWARRAGWLMVEWALVGFMWYVWFLVMIARIFLGVGRGAVGAVRWLLWL